jgi:hypothetical protein
MMNKPIIIVSAVIGVIFLVVAVIYFTTPALSLPHFFPGYSATLAKHHVTHGIASIVLAFVAFAIGWFQSGKKSTHEEKK